MNIYHIHPSPPPLPYSPLPSHSCSLTFTCILYTRPADSSTSSTHFLVVCFSLFWLPGITYHPHFNLWLSYPFLKASLQCSSRNFLTPTPSFQPYLRPLPFLHSVLATLACWLSLSIVSIVPPLGLCSCYPLGPECLSSGTPHGLLPSPLAFSPSSCFFVCFFPTLFFSCALTPI